MSLYDGLLATDSARPRQRDIDWPRLFSVSLIRLDVSGGQEVLATFPSLDPNPDQLVKHWKRVVQENWHVSAVEWKSLFADDPTWRVIFVGQVYSDEHRLVVVHPRHRLDEALARVAFEIEVAVARRIE